MLFRLFWTQSAVRRAAVDTLPFAFDQVFERHALAQEAACTDILLPEAGEQNFTIAGSVSVTLRSLADAGAVLDAPVEQIGS